MLFIVVPGQQKLVELKFADPPVSDSTESRTLLSLVKVREISEQYATGGLYLMTHYGDREELYRRENQRSIDSPMINETWRFCSVFSARYKNSIFMGRNWDNQNVGSIIISLTKPTTGFASVSFSRAIDMGFPLNVDIKEMAESPFREKLLLAPFYAYDGMNERGLCVAVAGVKPTTLKPRADKEFLFVPYLVRKILDQAGNIEKALNLIEKYVPFDLDKNSLNTHFLIADSSGKSVALEYREDHWEKTVGDKFWQVLTNKPIYNVPEIKLREQCWRFKSIAEALNMNRRNLDWKTSLKILQDVSQKGTTWSVIYSLPDKELYFSVYQNWDTIYHLKTF